MLDDVHLLSEEVAAVGQARAIMAGAAVASLFVAVLLDRVGLRRLLAAGGSAFTARAFKAVLSVLGIADRRGGYRDPEIRAFIGSWFGKLKERLIWCTEFETLDDARGGIAHYVDDYPHRWHSGLDYHTPAEVAATWAGGQTRRITAA
jgi:transposase InsO family protein